MIEGGDCFGDLVIKWYVGVGIEPGEPSPDVEEAWLTRIISVSSHDIDDTGEC